MSYPFNWVNNRKSHRFRKSIVSFVLIICRGQRQVLIKIFNFLSNCFPHSPALVWSNLLQPGQLCSTADWQNFATTPLEWSERHFLLVKYSASWWDPPEERNKLYGPPREILSLFFPSHQPFGGCSSEGNHSTVGFPYLPFSSSLFHSDSGWDLRMSKFHLTSTFA